MLVVSRFRGCRPGGRLGKASAGLVAGDWRPSATCAAPRDFLAGLELAGRAGGRQRLAMAAPFRLSRILANICNLAILAIVAKV